ncbi:MAG: MFS transporter [Sphingorhabdus sp.]
MDSETRAADPAEIKATVYSWYVLSILVLLYILNFIDRQVLTILAVDLKADLHIEDSDFGFLYGTAFGVFYALFGVPLGRLADNWHRIRLMTIGLSLWSMMTALSGLSKNLIQLAGARIGVGIGEATAGPSAYSLISDYFPKHQRATAIAIYTSGLYLGGGLSLFIGGAIVEYWNVTYPDHSGPLGLAGWQAAFMAVGLPGLLLAVWISTLREPVRGRFDGLVTGRHPRPFGVFFEDLASIIPPFTLIGASRRGANAVVMNLAVAALIGLVVYGMVEWTGDWLQWTAVGIGVYAVVSWAIALKHNDPPAFQLIWGTPAFLYVVVGYGLVAFNAYAVSAFAPAYAIQTFNTAPDATGFFLGGAGAAGGAIGVILGGFMADRFRKTNAAGRIVVALIGAVGPIIPFVVSFTTGSATLYYALHLPMVLLSSSALGASAATIVDLVLPRMRGTATAAFFIGTTLIGLSLGPYIAGKISEVTGDLATGMLSILAVAPISIIALLLAYRAVPEAAATIVERAKAAGEPI